MTLRVLSIDWDFGLIIEWAEEGRRGKGPRLREIVRIETVAAIYEWGSNMSERFRDADEDPEDSVAPDEVNRLRVEFDRVRQSLERDGIAIDPPHSRWLENYGRRGFDSQIFSELPLLS